MCLHVIIDIKSVNQRVFYRVQGKTVRLSSSCSLPYDNMAEESAFDNPVYETGVSMDALNLRDVDSQNTVVLS